MAARDAEGAARVAIASANQDSYHKQGRKVKSELWSQNFAALQQHQSSMIVGLIIPSGSQTVLRKKNKVVRT